MIEFKTLTKKRKIQIADNISQKFELPIVFYLRNREDESQIFYTFVVLDFAKKELTYIHTYLAENIKIFETHEERKMLNVNNITNPHCTIKVDSKGSFYAFMEQGNFFIHVDRNTGTMKVCFLKDVLELKDDANYAFGETFFKDDEDDDCLVFSLMKKSKKEDIDGELMFFRANMDFSNIKTLFDAKLARLFVPHVTRKINGFIYNSEFNLERYKIKKTGKIFFSGEKLSHYFQEKLFREFCKSSKKRFLRSDLMKNLQCMSPEFKSFCDEKGGDWLSICRKNGDYAFKALAGSFTAVDLEKRKIKHYKATTCMVAHFEIDPNGRHLYVSGHNFMRVGGMKYLGPATIDKFVINGGGLIKAGTFSDNTGYRFTTHRVFYHKKKPYICTIGQPNRMFFIDAEKMRKLHHYDIGQDVLSDKDDVAGFLNNTNTDKMTHVAFDVSKGGDFIVILGPKNIYFYNFSKKVMESSSIIFDPTMFRGLLDSESFFLGLTHTNYLK